MFSAFISKTPASFMTYIVRVISTNLARNTLNIAILLVSFDLKSSASFVEPCLLLLQFVAVYNISAEMFVFSVSFPGSVYIRVTQIFQKLQSCLRF
jgi:hypothetical protein